MLRLLNPFCQSAATGSSMSCTDSTPATRSAMSSVLWGFSALAFAGALIGVQLDRNSPQITQYFMAVQDTPVLFAIGLLCFALAWITRNSVAPSSDRNLLQMDARHAWISAVIVCFFILVIRHFVYDNYAL